jgi:transcription elongation factor/antiterminator RfaH
MAVGLRAVPPSGHVLHEGEHWYAVYAQPHWESIAQIRLRAQNFRTFLPLYSKTIHHARKCQTVLAPLFPRYLFIALDLGRDRWRAVNSTHGVTSLIMCEGLPAPVRSGVVETLLESSTSEGEVCFCSEMVPGSRVRLMAGPFAGQLGILRDLSRSGRVRVLIEMMGAHIPTELHERGVVPAALNKRGKSNGF